MKARKLLLTLGAAAAVGAGLLGCAGPSIQDYAGTGPKLDLVQYFSGRNEAWGMVQQRSGKLLRHFHARIDGRLEEGQLILDEHFDFDDGEQQRRVWTFTPVAADHWVGTAGDVVGQAHLYTAGNAVHMRYTLQVPVSGRVIHMKMDDWMFLLDENTLANRTSMRKFGLEMAEITVFFRKQPAASNTGAANSLATATAGASE